jgi:uncharacterized membrane protein
MFGSSDIRAEARRVLTGNWLTAVGVCIVAGILTGGGSGFGTNVFTYSINSGGEAFGFLQELSGPGLAALAGVLIMVGGGLLMLGIAFAIVGPVVQLGQFTYFLKMVRGDKPGFSVLFSQFRYIIKAFCLSFMVGLFTMLWALLFIIPGIIAAYRYSMAMYILADNPEIGIFEAINESKDMMSGYKASLFVLRLSFIGWAILCIFTCGIGIIVLNPYMQAADAVFYTRLTGTEERDYTETDERSYIRHEKNDWDKDWN